MRKTVSAVCVFAIWIVSCFNAYAAITPTQPPPVDPVSTMPLKIKVNQFNATYTAPVQNKTITPDQMVSMGSATLTISSLAESEGVTSTLDQWLWQNKAFLQSQYPSGENAAGLAFLLNHGTHYVLSLAGQMLAQGSGLENATNVLPARLLNVRYGTPRVLRVGAECRNSGIVAAALVVFGTFVSYYAPAMTVLGPIGFGALLVGAVIGLAVAAYCVT